MRALHRILYALLLGWLTLCVAYFAGFKLELFPAISTLFAVMVGGLGLLVVLAMAETLVRLLRRDVHVLRGLGSLLLLGGLLGTGGGGMLNYLRGIQGFVVMTEGDVLPLHHGNHIQGLDTGPLAQLTELDLVLELGEVEQRGVGQGGYLMEATLLARDSGGAVERMKLTSRHFAVHRSLRFHIGAFGYAPQLVVRRGGRTLLDQMVHFNSTPIPGRGVVFTAEHEVGGGLTLQGEVLHDSLDPAMRGHPQLGLSLSRGEELLGRGTLRMGQFVTMPDEHEMGFAGLKKWVEIDISRRSYPAPVFAGMGISLVGALLWPIGLALDRRRR